MALPSRYNIEKKINSMEGLSAYENGGKGSGNFGHSGRPGYVGGSGDGGGGFSEGDNVTFYQYGENHKGRIIRKISEKEKQDRADLNNPNAGDYYEVETGSGDFASKSIVWEGRIKKAEKQSKEKKGSGEISLKGKSLYEKVHMIEPGDEVHITPKDNLPNFDKKIKVDYIQDGTIHYGSSETSDGYTYPAWAIKDITKIVRKKKNEVELNGGKGSGNFGHAGRPGEVGGSGKGTGASSGSGYVPKHKKDMRIREAILKSITGQKELQDRAKVVQEDIEDRIGQKVKEGEEYTALDEALKERFKYFHGEDGTEYTYDKGNGMITKTNPKTGDQEVVTKQKKDYGSEKSDLVSNEGSDLGVTRKDFETAKQVTKERAGKMSIYEDEKDGLYHAKDNFYDRKFDTRKGVVAFKSGYDDGDKASSFDRLDYTKRQTKSGDSRYDVSYKGTDKSYGKSFNNPIEARYYTEGYNSKIRAIESEVPRGAWKKIEK